MESNAAADAQGWGADQAEGGGEQPGKALGLPTKWFHGETMPKGDRYLKNNAKEATTASIANQKLDTAKKTRVRTLAVRRVVPARSRFYGWSSETGQNALHKEYAEGATHHEVGTI